MENFVLKWPRIKKFGSKLAAQRKFKLKIGRIAKNLDQNWPHSEKFDPKWWF
jgi:hypothetical protein